MDIELNVVSLGTSSADTDPSVKPEVTLEEFLK